MRKGLLSSVLVVASLYASAQGAGYEERAKSYIEQYKSLAVAEQKRSGVPAAITLAQGIHETSAGASELATMANNHFGIKCKKSWTGETFAHTDDAPNECFRKYSRAEESYKDHSDYLVTSPRYAELFKLSVTDYASWAVGLKRCGYATNPRYAQVLIKLVEDYKLQEFTYAALNNTDINTGYASAPGVYVPEEDAREQEATVAKTTAVVTAPVAPAPVVTTPVAVSTPVSAPAPDVLVAEEIAVQQPEMPAVAETTSNAFKPAYGQMVRVNGLKAVYARKGDTPLEYAYKTSIRYQKLLEMNEIDERPLPQDMYLYLERKNTKGVRATHTVRQGETIFSIAQAEGMMVKSLMDMNMIEPNEEPIPGTILELQQFRTVKPVVMIKKKEAATAYVKPTAYPVAAPVASANVPTTVPTNKQSTQPARIKVVEEIKEPEVVKAEQKPIEISIQPQAVVKQQEVAVPVVQEEVVTTQSLPVSVSLEPPVEAAKTEPVKATEEVKANDPIKPAIENAQPKVVAASMQNITPEPVAVKDVPKPVEPAKTEEPVVVEQPKQIVEMETVASVTKPATLPTAKPATVTAKKVEVPVIEEEPKDELDKLKRKFDKVVYAKDNTRAATPSQPTIVTVPKPDTMRAITKPAETVSETSAQIQPSTDPAKFHVVKKGETGFSIAKKYGITVRQLNDWNNLNFGAIQEGQKLRVKP
ncbi:MAG: LysM peptidoglycan-binding domain-containing protein [Chitinophagales bacterium]|nr:LysM peptidoglycan-binding domain-containing protein [Chitinophagales bacterium]